MRPRKIPIVFDPFAPDVFIDRVPSPLARVWGFAKSILLVGTMGAILGATIGAAVRTINHSVTAALIGGIPLALIGVGVLGPFGAHFGLINRIRFGGLVGTTVGILAGGAVGALAGLAVRSFLWSLGGAIIGFALGGTLLARLGKPPYPLVGILLGVCSGIVALAIRTDRHQGLAGVLVGSLVGAATSSGLLAALAGWLIWSPKPSWHREWR
jgi:hypothetical protein